MGESSYTPGGRLLAAINNIPVEAVPLSIRRSAIPLRWNQHNLWNLEIPPSTMSVADLAWLLDLPAWQHEGIPFRLTPNQVAVNRAAFAQQYARTFNADLDRPLIVTSWKRRWTILDGLHRLLKAKIMGVEEVPVRRLARTDWRKVSV